MTDLDHSVDAPHITADAAAEAATAAAAAPEPPDAGRVAEIALAFESRLAGLGADVDPSWLQEFASRAPALGLLPDGDARRHQALAGPLKRFCGALPGLDRLAAAPAGIALQARPVVLRALGLLALARRPGVLRCCVDRGQRELLLEGLGDAIDAIDGFAERGRPVSHEATIWTPLHWSCLGYLDWSGLLARDDRFLRRFVRLLLPRGLLDMPQRLALARADLPAAEAIERLAAAGVAWPC